MLSRPAKTKLRTAHQLQPGAQVAHPGPQVPPFFGSSLCHGKKGCLNDNATTFRGDGLGRDDESNDVMFCFALWGGHNETSLGEL